MAQIQAPATYNNGDTVTAANLNSHVAGATLLPDAIDAQTDRPLLATSDTFLVTSGATLKKVTLANLLKVSPIIGGTTPAAVTATTLASTTLTTSGLATVGLLTSTGLATAGSLSVGGTSAHTGAATFASTAAFTGAATFDGAVSGTGVTPAIVSDKPNTSTGYIGIPSGTTGQRPASPASGNMRYNSTLAAMEYYTGSAWVAVPQGVAAKAWVNFDGTKDTTGATSTANTNRLIRASENVASVLRNSVGDYTVSFTTQMTDANYATTGLVNSPDGYPGRGGATLHNSVAPTAAAVRLETASIQGVSNPRDCSIVCITVIR